MEKQEGVKAIVLSGMRATVVMEKGATLREETVREAFKKSGVNLVSLGVEDQAVAKYACRMNAKGLG